MVFETFLSLAKSKCFTIIIRMREILFHLIHLGQGVFSFREIMTLLLNMKITS